MTADRWAQVARQTQQQLRLGRLLPLGGAGDGAWLAESAAGEALRRTADGLPGILLGSLRIAPAGQGRTHSPAVPAPPSALPPGPLRIVAEFAAPPTEPIPASATLLRRALAATATGSLGLSVTEVDLRVTELLDGAPVAETTVPEATVPLATLPETAAPEPDSPSESGRSGPGPAEADETRAAAAARAVPGVTRLTGTLGGLGRAVHIEERTTAAGKPALPRRHVRVEIAVSRGHRPLEVTRAVRTAVSDVLPDHPTTAVLVTALD